MALPVQSQFRYWGIATAVFFVILWFLGNVLLPFDFQIFIFVLYFAIFLVPKPLPAGALFSEKMTSLETSDMYFVQLMALGQYFGGMQTREPSFLWDQQQVLDRV